MTKTYALSAILLILIISLSNFWIYRIYEHNFFLGELLIIEAALLSMVALNQKGKIVTILIFVILFILGFFLLKNNFDKNIFSVSTIESIQIEERKMFYGTELGKFYGNRIGIVYFHNLRGIFGKINDNLFTSLDLSLYFETYPEKYPLFFAPLFIIGFLSFLLNIRTVIVIYILIAIGISSFVTIDSKLGPITMFPFISLCIAIGLRKLIEKLHE